MYKRDRIGRSEIDSKQTPNEIQHSLTNSEQNLTNSTPRSPKGEEEEGCQDGGRWRIREEQRGPSADRQRVLPLPPGRGVLVCSCRAPSLFAQVPPPRPDRKTLFRRRKKVRPQSVRDLCRPKRFFFPSRRGSRRGSERAGRTSYDPGRLARLARGDVRGEVTTEVRSGKI